MHELLIINKSNIENIPLTDLKKKLTIILAFKRNLISSVSNKIKYLDNSPSYPHPHQKNATYAQKINIIFGAISNILRIYELELLCHSHYYYFLFQGCEI